MCWLGALGWHLPKNALLENSPASQRVLSFLEYCVDVLTVPSRVGRRSLGTVKHAAAHRDGDFILHKLATLPAGLYWPCSDHTTDLEHCLTCGSLVDRR